MAQTIGDVVVFCDATARWEPNGIHLLASGFADPSIGCISGYKTYWLEDGFGALSYKKYWDLEGNIDTGSSVLGYIPNASGGLHAMRRKLYPYIPNHLIHDLVDPAHTLGQGYLAIVDPEVRYLDAPWVGTDEVSNARIRITQRALMSTPYILRQLRASGRPWTLWQFISHKLLRWILWLPLLALFFSSIWLSLTQYPPAVAVLIAFLSWLGMSFAHVFFPRSFVSTKVGHHALFLLLSFLGMFEGFRRTLLGQTRSTWKNS